MRPQKTRADLFNINTDFYINEKDLNKCHRGKGLNTELIIDVHVLQYVTINKF